MKGKAQLADELGMSTKTLLRRVKLWLFCLDEKPFDIDSYKSWRSLTPAVYELLKLEL